MKVNREVGRQVFDESLDISLWKRKRDSKCEDGPEARKSVVCIGEVLYRVTEESLMVRLDTNMQEACLQISKDFKRYLCGVLDTHAIPQAQRPPLDVNVDEFENDGFIVNDLDDEEEDMPDIDDEKQKKKRKKRQKERRRVLLQLLENIIVDKAARCFKLIVRAEDPTMQTVVDEDEPKKEVTPKPPPIEPKREELRRDQAPDQCENALKKLGVIKVSVEDTALTAQVNL
nr:hypothetical protein [Tanacetum cinerariifolium]